ncbi:MAG: hypothetical protein FJZ87_15155 [Chloroflexi bacterium]|nr:hypothetical protein [Chloroflexota bacterium]
MVIYYRYIFHIGPAGVPDSNPEVEDLQERHVANYRRLNQEGKLVLNRPLLDSFQMSGEARGAGGLKAESFAQALEKINTDPMVKMGRLAFELHPWMINQGSLA